jgi:hypothetical protein
MWWYIDYPIWWDQILTIVMAVCLLWLDWEDIQILIPDLDSPENFTSGGI